MKFTLGSLIAIASAMAALMSDAEAMMGTPTVPSCLSTIKNLAEYDRWLGENTVNATSSRLVQKLGIAPYYDTATNFAGAVGFLKSRGNGFSCGYTTYWVGEIFNGLSGQFKVLQNGGNGDQLVLNSNAGYFEKVGDDLIAYFEQQSKDPAGYNYYVSHGGNADHVYQIEQLPGGKGYRLYQSYNSVYSLKAWLEDKASLQTLWSDDPSKGHIIPNWKLYNIIDQSIQTQTQGAYNINTLPSGVVPDALYQYIQYWKDQSVNKTKIISDIETSKKLYGNGRIIPKAEFFSDYLAKLGNLTQFYKDAGGVPGGTDTIVTQEIFDAWTLLYASPNPLLVAGQPYSTMVSVLSPTHGYFFQILPMKTGAASRCVANSNPIKRSLK